MNIQFKDLKQGSIIYALIKGSELKYVEGSIVSIGLPRVDSAKNAPNAFPTMPSYMQVVDVTYALDGKNYTDAVDVNASVFPTNKPGAMTLVATDVEYITKELHATLKQSEQYLKDVEHHKATIGKCRELIGQLDTEFNERQKSEERLERLEKKMESLAQLIEKKLK